eukprot:gene1886-2222_t
MYLPAATVEEAAGRFAGTFPALQVLYETPYTISHTGDPNAQEEDDETAVPLGLLLQHLPGLQAVRANTFENLGWMRSLEGLQHLQHLQQLSLHISVPSYFDIFHFCLIHPMPEGGIPLFHSISKLRSLQRLQLTFELTGAEVDVVDLIRNIAQLPQLQSLALPQQLLCPGCYPGLGAKVNGVAEAFVSSPDYIAAAWSGALACLGEQPGVRCYRASGELLVLPLVA